MNRFQKLEIDIKNNVADNDLVAIVKKRMYLSFLVNPNISPTKLYDDEFKKRFYEIFQNCMDEMEFILPQYQIPYEGKMSNAQVINYQWNPEIGSKKGSIHVHGIVAFDVQTNLDYSGISKWLKKYLNGLVTNPLIRFKHYRDHQAMIKAYISKQQGKQPLINSEAHNLADQPKGTIE